METVSEEKTVIEISCLNTHLGQIYKGFFLLL